MKESKASCFSAPSMSFASSALTKVNTFKMLYRIGKTEKYCMPGFVPTHQKDQHMKR